METQKYISDIQPSKDELLSFIGETRQYYEAIEELFIKLNPKIEVMLHNKGKGGWIIKHYIRRKYVAQFNIIEGSFELMCRYDEKASTKMFDIAEKFVGNGRGAWKNRYTCGTGFWIHLWVNNEQDYKDALLAGKIVVESK